MTGNFEACLRQVLRHEGGWSDHPDDPGGATMKGVTLATYRQFKGREASKVELRAISDAELRAIYRRGYWDRVRGDDLPAGLDLVAFDGAVNSGPAQGAKWLQRALGVADDGVVGPVTLAAARAADRPAAIRDACARRMAFLRGLAAFAVFGRGWTRRVDEIRDEALRMTAAVPAPMVPESAGLWAFVRMILRKLVER